MADTTAAYLVKTYPQDDDAKQGYIDLADFYRDNKEYERAISLFLDQIETGLQSEETVDAYRDLAYTYIDLNDIDNAFTLYRQKKRIRS